MKNWLITGANRGLGRVFALAALERGDRVAATARDITGLADLAGRFGENVIALPLDVTDRQACHDSVSKAKQVLGRLDVVVNNAG